MTAWLDPLNAMSSAWAALVFTVAWQWTLVVAAIALLAAALRGASPAARYWLWQIAAVKLLLMPLWTASLALPLEGVPTWMAKVDRVTPTATAEPALRPVGKSPPAGAQPGAIASAAATATSFPASATPSPPLAGTLASRITWSTWLLLGWLAGMLFLLVRLALQACRLSRLLVNCRPAEPHVLNLAADAASTIRLPVPPRILVTQQPCSPFACGLLRPTIVLPEAFLVVLNPIELRQVLLHELAHIKRRDLAWGWVVQAARVLYFFHPAVHWLAGRVRLERELACDHVAMNGAGRTPAQYAESLAHIVSQIAQRPTAALGLALTGGEPSGRIHGPSTDIPPAN